MNEPPVLYVKGYKVDPVLFTRGYSKGCGPYQCSSICCSDGVWVDPTEKEKILQEQNLIKRYMDETQLKDSSRWFSEHNEDDDFPSGECEGTTVHNDTCVFLNKEGLCVLQVAATEEGRSKWDIKPFYCVLFPISIADKTLTFDEHKQGEAPCCTIDEQFLTPFFRACKEEIIFAVGEDGYEELENYYRQYKDYFQNEEVSRDAF